MPEKVIGILGGMGPEATIDLFHKIIKSTAVKKDQEHLRIIIDNNPKIPDRTAAILGKGEDPVTALQNTAKNLEKAGADFIIIPCNTAHYFLPSIIQSVKIPILNMIEETAKEVRQKIPQANKVGLLASIGTYKTEIYRQQFKQYNLEIIYPYDGDKKEIMKVIYEVKAGNLSEDIKGNILKISQKLIDSEAEVIIAGCTEISLILKEEELPVPLIDPTKILAEAAVKKARW